MRIPISIFCLFTMMAGRADAGTTPYQGFESLGGTSGDCMVLVGSSIQMEYCGTDGIAKNNVFSYTRAGKIKINSLCLDLQTVNGFQYVVANTCSGATTQLWRFHSGNIQNQATNDCMNDFGFNGSGSDSVEMGSCAVIDTGTNLWMPTRMPMIFSTMDNLAIQDLDQSYNSDNDDTALADPFQNPNVFFQAEIWKSPAGVTTILTNTVDGMALDLFAAHIDPTTQTGEVDLATPNGTLAQTWYFASEGTNPENWALIKNGSNNQQYCLDLQGDNVQIGTPIDLFACDSQYGNGNNPAQLWVATLDGFPEF